MKKIIGIILFLTLIIIAFNIKNLKPNEQTTYYSDVIPEQLKEISIDAKDVNITFITTAFNEISIKRTTTVENSEDIVYGSNYIDGKLIIKQNIRSENNGKIKDNISIQIPEYTELDSLNINVEKGSVNLKNIKSTNTLIASKDSLKSNVEDSTFKNLEVSSNEIESKLKNVVIKEKVLYNVGNGTVENFNVIGDKEEVYNKGPLKYKNSDTYFNKTSLKETNVELYFKLLVDKNYYFNNVKNKLSKPFLEEDRTDYNYNGQTKEIDKYTIEVNGNVIKEIEVQ